MELSIKQLDRIVGEIGSNYDRIDGNYSGRGMYGKNCLCLVSDSPTAVTEMLFELARQQFISVNKNDNHLDSMDLDELRDHMSDFTDQMRTDNMGYSTVYYWPSITVIEED